MIDLNGRWELCFDDRVIPAQVPGNFELDLWRHGLIDDPYVSDHAKQVLPYEIKYFKLRRKFNFGEEYKRSRLVLDGVDCYAEVRLNGQIIGHCDNAFYPHRFEVTRQLISGENVLEIAFTPPKLKHRDIPPEARYFSSFRDNYDATRSRRPIHVTGWDIAPRLPLGGVFHGVNIEEIPFAEWDVTYIQCTPVCNEQSAMLMLTLSFRTGDDDLTGYHVKVKGVCQDSEFIFERKLANFAGAFRIECPKPRYWLPRNYGEQNLYTVDYELYRHDQLLATRRQHIGLRVVEFHQAQPVASPHKDQPQAYFTVNGIMVRLLGTNWVPPDAMHSRGMERQPLLLAMLDELQCNTVRVWGGGIYERESFYDFCDQHGIMVWQDIAMACAVYPHDPNFLNSLQREMEQVIPRLRHHPSIICWCGDNECDLVPTWSNMQFDPNANIITRRLLPEVLHRLDPLRPYIPSSPHINPEVYQKAKATGLPVDRCSVESHLWGARNYFKNAFYAESTASFATEIGYHAAPAAESIRAFIPSGFEEYAPDNYYWLHHASNPFLETDDELNYRVTIMAKQIEEMFGFVPEKLEDFVAASQICHAEANKYFIELFRADPGKSGIVWWNLADCWPQFSDAVVDYYNRKKLAYHYIRRSQSPFLALLTQPDGWSQKLLLLNDRTTPASGRVIVRSFEHGTIYLDVNFAIKAHSRMIAGELELRSSIRELRLIEWQLEDGTVGINHFMTGSVPFDFAQYRDYYIEAIKNKLIKEREITK